MERQGEKPIVFSDFRGGRNGVDPPLSIGANECCDAYNVEFWQSTLGRKRGGSVEMSLTGGPDAPYWMGAARHVPASSDFAAELWAVSTDYSTKALWQYSVAGGWSEKTDLAGGNLNSDGWYDFCSFNGKLFMAVSRPRSSSGAIAYLRVWDGTNLRTVGFSTPAVCTAADDGSGSYAATTRYYKVAYTTQVSGVTKRRSELSSATAFTPSGSGTDAKVTKPAALGNGETHWELYASAALLGPYSLIATTAVGTDHVHDSATPSAYSGSAPPEAGSNTRPSGHRYLATDGSHLLMAVPYLSTGVTVPNRVEWTPALGSTDIGDDERCPAANYLDLGASDGDYITGMAKEPLHNEVYVFKKRHIYKLTPTGNSAAPFAESLNVTGVGAVSNDSIVMAEDAIYFMSERGPYRLSSGGLEFIGRNVEDLVTNVGATCNAAYYPAKAQIWFVLHNASGLSHRLVYDLRGGGWARWSVSTDQYYTVPFAKTYTSCTDAVVPYGFINGAGGGANGVIHVCDSGTADAGTAFQSYVVSAQKTPSGLLTRCTVDEPVLVAKAQSGSVVQITVSGDYGLTTASAIVGLTPQKAETRISRKAEGLGLGSATAVQYTIGDASAVASSWCVDALVAPASSLEPR